MIEQISCKLKESERLGKELEEAQEVYKNLQTARPLEEWHEDCGDVLWWELHVAEPPYCGSPLCSDWPGYHTHWTPIVTPDFGQEGEGNQEGSK
ncbi:hypothetical protein [Paenibacillus amylolyticus]|uniref:hypothetical protein n=1 Tax=Paenibacillus amylolyticus TaxID=1451 RepID=UPI00249BE028|nr:hypothetical protein [Paenibacillus amylolyticus]WFA86483.1 hypothetical protein OGI70_06025 [Paenibacillus amylolyticus]